MQGHANISGGIQTISQTRFSKGRAGEATAGTQMLEHGSTGLGSLIVPEGQTRRATAQDSGAGSRCWRRGGSRSSRLSLCVGIPSAKEGLDDLRDSFISWPSPFKEIVLDLQRQSKLFRGT